MSEMSLFGVKSYILLWRDFVLLYTEIFYTEIHGTFLLGEQRLSIFYI